MWLYILKILFLKEKLEKLLHCNTNRAEGVLGGRVLYACLLH